MNVAGLIGLYRFESGDDAQPPFVTDERLIALAVEAEEEACRRAELLRDSTSAMCSVAVTADNAVVTIDPRIIDVRRARLASDTFPLGTLTVDEMDEAHPGWEDETGTPRAVVTGYQTNALRLWPVPTANDTLRLTVTRLPLTDVNAVDDTPEIPAPYHRKLAQWLLYRVYSVQDSELFDAQKADKCLAAFEREFGKEQSARNEQWRRERIQISATPIA